MSDSELAAAKQQQQQQTEDQKSKQIAATSELGLMPANLGSVLNETSSKKKSKFEFEFSRAPIFQIIKSYNFEVGQKLGQAKKLHEIK